MWVLDRGEVGERRSMGRGGDSSPYHSSHSSSLDIFVCHGRDLYIWSAFLDQELQVERFSRTLVKEVGFARLDWVVLAFHMISSDRERALLCY
jgi:hypothetical protein